MLIWLASYPRSGNTYFRLVWSHLYGLPTYENYSWSSEGAHQFDFNNFIQQEVQPETLHGTDGLHLVKTHDLPKDDYPAIYIVRDGRDALISHASFVLEFDFGIKNPSPELFRQTLRMLIESNQSFGGWSGNLRAWCNRPAPTVIVKFEELIASPLDCVRRAASAIGVQPAEVCTSPLATFDELRTVQPRFFRRGQIGAWRQIMPDDLHLLFWNQHADMMRGMGYSEPLGSRLRWAVSAAITTFHSVWRHFGPQQHPSIDRAEAQPDVSVGASSLPVPDGEANIALRLVLQERLNLITDLNRELQTRLIVIQKLHDGGQVQNQVIEQLHAKVKALETLVAQQQHHLNTFRARTQT